MAPLRFYIASNNPNNDHGEVKNHILLHLLRLSPGVRRFVDMAAEPKYLTTPRNIINSKGTENHIFVINVRYIETWRLTRKQTSIFTRSIDYCTLKGFAVSWEIFYKIGNRECFSLKALEKLPREMVSWPISSSLV
jgi:hypothetical protein